MKLTKLASLFAKEFMDITSNIVMHWPGQMGNFIRYRYYMGKLKYLGKGAVIDFGVHIVNPSKISIGDMARIDRNVTLIAGAIREDGRKLYHKPNPSFKYEAGEIHIGSGVHIAPHAYLLGVGGIDIGDSSGVASGARIFSISNDYCNRNDPEDKKLYSFTNRVPCDEQSMIVSPVVMESNTGIGLNSVALPGSTISSNSWVGVLSCVTGTVPPGVIAGGSPTNVLKHRDGASDGK